jgi:hypothetical protein
LQLCLNIWTVFPWANACVGDPNRVQVILDVFFIFHILFCGIWLDFFRPQHLKVMGSVLKFFCRIRVKVIYFITYIQLNILRKYQAVLSHPLILKSKFVQHQIYFTNPMSDVLFIYYYIHNNIMIILMVSIFAVQFISKNGNIE